MNPNWKTGTFDLGEYPGGYKGNQYRIFDGVVQYRGKLHTDWRNSNDYSRLPRLQLWVDGRAKELGAVMEVKLNGYADMVIAVISMRHSLKRIKDLLKEEDTTIEEIREVVAEAMEDACITS
jgi:hypothetical protein